MKKLSEYDVYGPHLMFYKYHLNVVSISKTDIDRVHCIFFLYSEVLHRIPFLTFLLYIFLLLSFYLILILLFLLKNI